MKKLGFNIHIFLEFFYICLVQAHCFNASFAKRSFALHETLNKIKLFAFPSFFNFSIELETEFILFSRIVLQYYDKCLHLE